jgi:hypothetical protein
VTTALYATTWMALALFVAAEAGRQRLSPPDRPAAWARPALILGVLLMVCHVLLALGFRYGWNHDAAVRETARQAAAVYGFEWRGNIYVSYAFVVLWFVEVWRWPARADRGTAATDGIGWALRAFFFSIIFNGAVVFATTAWSRALGVVLVTGLVWAWWPIETRALRAADATSSENLKVKT